MDEENMVPFRELFDIISKSESYNSGHEKYEKDLKHHHYLKIQFETQSFTSIQEFKNFLYRLLTFWHSMFRLTEHCNGKNKYFFNNLHNL